VLAPAAIAAFFVVNWGSTRMCGRSQVIGSALKGIGLCILIVVMLFADTSEIARPQSAPSSTTAAIGIGGIIVGLRQVYNTYAGWNVCTYFCEEIHKPERCVPRSLFGGIAIVTGLYLLVNIAILRILSPADIAGSTLAAGDALNAAIGKWADIAVTLFGLVSVAALTNLGMMFCSRIAFAMGRHGALPAPLARIAPGGTPRNGLIATASIAGILAASGNYEQLVAFSVALGLFTDLVVSLAAIQLRRLEPDLPRPWRAPLYPASIIAAVLLEASLLAALIWNDPFHSLSGTGFAVALGLAYALKQAVFRPRAALT
jgi:APA family basic amino acid/polyamine antiporter